MARVNKKTNEVMVDCNISFMDSMMNEYNLFSCKTDKTLNVMGEYVLNDYDPLIQEFIDEAVNKWNNGLRGYYKIDEFYDFVGQKTTFQWNSYKKIKEYYN